MEMENPSVPSKSDQKALLGHLHFCKVKTKENQQQTPKRNHFQMLFNRLLKIAFNCSCLNMLLEVADCTKHAVMGVNGEIIKPRAFGTVFLSPYL